MYGEKKAQGPPRLGATGGTPAAPPRLALFDIADQQGDGMEREDHYRTIAAKCREMAGQRRRSHRNHASHRYLLNLAERYDKAAEIGEKAFAAEKPAEPDGTG